VVGRVAVGEYLPPLVTELKADISGLKKGFDEAKAAAKKYKEDIDRISGGFRQTKTDADGAGKAVSDFDRLVRSKMRTSESAVSAVRREWDLLQRKIKDARKELGKSGGDADKHAELKTLTKDAAALTGIASDIGIKLGDGLGKSLGNAMTALGPVVQTVVAAALIAAALLAAPVVGGVLAAALTLGLGGAVVGLAAYILKDDKQIKKAWEKLTETTSEVFKRAVQPMKKPFLELLGWLRVEFVKLEPELTNLFKAAAPLVKPLGEGIFGMLKNMLPGITEALKNSEPVFKTLGETLPIIGTAIGDMFKSITEDPEALSTFLSDLIKVVAGFIVILGELIGWLTRTYTDVREWFKKIQKFFDELPGKVKKALGNPATWLGGTGAAIMQGLIGGIESKIPALTGALKNAMAAGVAASKKELKSKSPSLVYFQMGQDTVDGYRLGVQRSQPAAWAALAGLMAPRPTTPGALAAAVGAVPAGRGAGGAVAVEGVAHIYLDGREIQQAGIRYAQRDKMRNTNTGWE
jgi:predicted phage tail protein